MRDLRQRIPSFSAEVRFFETSEGGRKGPVPNGFGCPCMLQRESREANDARMLFSQDWVALGTVVTADFFFVFGEEASDKFRNAGHFYLWESRIIGETTLLKSSNPLQLFT